MGLYQQLNKISENKQVSLYEEIIKEINEQYEIIKRKCTDFNSHIDSKVDYCLDKGREGFKYYLPEYYDTPSYNEKYKLLEDKIEILKLETQRIDKKVISPIKSSIIFIETYLNKSNDPRYNKLLAIKNNLEKQNLDSKVFNTLYLKEIMNNFSDLLEIPYVKASIFQASSAIDKEYASIFVKIKPDLDKNLNNGLKITDAINKALETNNINLDTTKMLDTLTTKVIDFSEKEKGLRQNVSNLLKESLINDMFIGYTKTLKEKYKHGIETGKDSDDVLKELIPEAYGLVKFACEVSMGIKPYDVQLMGALALNDGNIAQMYTGEGKTITAILPAYLNALTGREVDIFTPNDYLAERDAESNKKVFELLGLSVGCVKIDGQSVEEKQNAYKKDIVYGSSTAFAFDYLTDTNEKDLKKLLQRSEKPGFVIVDEADQILINNALTPYVLSNGSGHLSKKQKLENQEIKEYLEDAYEIERKLSQKVYYASTNQEFEAITGGNKRVTSEVDNKYSIVVLQEKTTGTGNINITKRGRTEIFYLGMQNEIDELTQKTRTFFEESNEYIQDKDYKIINGKITLTTEGLEKASNDINEFFDLRLKWNTDEVCLIKQKYITNAVTVQYLMENGITYQVGIDPETHKEIVQVLQDGRIVPNSKFNDGIHEAIMLKEGLSINITSGESLLGSELGSVSNRALLSRYSKKSGMTGTADKSAFYDIYGMNTFSVPRHKEYIYKKDPTNNDRPTPREDKPMVLCKTKEEKYNAIIESIKESQKKGQPVLVVTNNTEEAEEFYRKVTELGLFSNLLIADRNLEQENEIIANAGRKGAITIATEMAGRGTDIKLGGIQDNKKILESTLLKMALDNLVLELERKEKGLTLNEREEFIRSKKKELAKTNPELIKKTYLEYMDKYSNDEKLKKIVDGKIEKSIKDEINSIKASGGLNYIQMTPFKTRRNDNQGKGRVGRQGEPGSTIIYTSIEELSDIGIDREKINSLKEIMKDKNSIDDGYADGLISEIVEVAQAENEFQMDMQIAQSDSLDLAMSSYCARLFKYKKQAAKCEDFTIVIDNMIYKVITECVKNNVDSKKQKKVDKDKTRISRLKLNKEGLAKEIKEIFGVSIDPELILKECTDVSDLKFFIKDIVDEKKKELETGVPKESLNRRIKEAVIVSANSIYTNFVESSTTVKNQMFNDRLANNSSHDRMNELIGIYKEATMDGYKHTLQSIFKVKTKTQTNVVTEEINEHIEEIRNENIQNRISIFNTSSLNENISINNSSVEKEETKKR